MNLENLEVKIQETMERTEVDKTQMVQKALSRCNTKEQKVVLLGCRTWLRWKEMGKNISGLRELIPDQTGMKYIPEVMANKTFAIANRGFTVKGFIEARDSINKALEKRPDNVQYEYTKFIIMKKLNQTESHKEVSGIRIFFKNVINALFPMYSELHGLAKVQHAVFLAKINRKDYGESWNRFAEESEEVAGSNRVTLRTVAEFYLQTAA